MSPNQFRIALAVIIGIGIVTTISKVMFKSDKSKCIGKSNEEEILCVTIFKYIKLCFFFVVVSSKLDVAFHLSL